MIIKKLDRYVGIHVLGSTIVVFLMLGAVTGAVTLLEELDQIEKNYTIGIAAQYVLLILPSILYQMLPLIVLVGTLIGLGILASSSELTVIRSVGISTGRILGMVSKAIIPLALLSLLLGEFGIPAAQQKAQILKSENLSTFKNTSAWLKDKDDSFIKVGAVSVDQRIYGITEYRFEKENALTTLMTAEFAEYKNGRWELHNITEFNFNEARTVISKVFSDKVTWDINLAPDFVQVLLVDPRELKISQLKAYADFLNDQGVDAGRYYFEWWNKLLQPLVIVQLVAVAVAFIFGPLRSVSIGQRILTGVLVGLSLKITQDIIGPASQVFGIPSFLAAFAPLVLLFIGSVYLYRRVA